MPSIAATSQTNMLFSTALFISLLVHLSLGFLPNCTISYPQQERRMDNVSNNWPNLKSTKLNLLSLFPSVYLSLFLSYLSTHARHLHFSLSHLSLLFTSTILLFNECSTNTSWYHLYPSTIHRE